MLKNLHLLDKSSKIIKEGMLDASVANYTRLVIILDLLVNEGYTIIMLGSRDRGTVFAHVCNM